MRSWIITLPKKIPWKAYQEEIDFVEDGASVMNYKLRYFPKGMCIGDRCYVTHCGVVKGWMAIVGLQEHSDSWTCTTTGQTWPPGRYLQRSGHFTATLPYPMKGFRGIRAHEEPSLEESCLLCYKQLVHAISVAGQIPTQYLSGTYRGSTRN